MPVRILSLTLCLAVIPIDAAPAQTKPAAATGPEIRLIPAKGNNKVTFEVIALKPADLAALSKVNWKPEQWTALFAVYVTDNKQGAQVKTPAMLGSYRVDKSRLVFEPRFPLTPGLTYKAVFDPTKLPGHATDTTKPIATFFGIAKPPAQPATAVERIYPSAATLPENQLRFYIHFSAPMMQGEAYDRIRLLDDAGKNVDHPFLELAEELWDTSGQRLTLLFHPGRVKRGLKPREELGPILREGKTYTLLVDRSWKDAGCTPLKESFRKAFKAGPPEERQLNPKEWKIEAPAAASRTSLTVRFPRSLDHALLERMLWVADQANQKIAGTMATDRGETVWHFTPAKNWSPGTYRLVADTRLEDSAGNSIARPFEVDQFSQIDRGLEAKTIEIPFGIR